MSRPRATTSGTEPVAPVAPGAPPSEGGPRVRGAAIVYRLYDIGYEIHLDRALDLLASRAPARVRPVRGEAQALQIRNPPVTVLLGTEQVYIGGEAGGRRYDAEISARIFDFGVVSLRLRVPTPGDLTWREFSGFGNAVDVAAEVLPPFDHHLRLLREQIAPAVERPTLAPVTEDYIVYRIVHLTSANGTPVTAEALRDVDVAPLLLNEWRPLSTDARRELLPHRFSYYAEDLAILTWDNALVVDPAPHDTDVEYVLEFANAQLLELRYYDAVLDAELPTLYDRIAAARSKPVSLLRSRFAGLLGQMQTLVADSTENAERAENALKVTDDVYLARIYLSALEIFRGRAWRAGLDRKIAIIRDTYTMLNGEAQVARSHALELTIVLLIVLEILLAWVF